jgi:uncharacterized membrane protein
MSKRLPLALVILSLIGLADALYLVVATYTDTPIVCGLIEGCNDVAKSPFTRILGIPLSVYGTGYYLVALALSLGIMQWGTTRARQLMFLWAFAGVLFSAYTVYLQAVVIEAWCMWCVLSEIVTVLLLAFSWPLRRPREASLLPGS